MLIGILSDTHDDMEAIERAVGVFNEMGVSFVIHAGDIISPFTFEALSGLRAEFRGIFGNNDGDKVLLRQKSKDRVLNQPLFIELGGKRLAVVHEPDMAVSLAKSGDFDVVIYGHTHEPDIRKIKGTLVINPGKAAKLHKGAQSMAVLNTESMKAEIIGLKGG